MRTQAATSAVSRTGPPPVGVDSPDLTSLLDRSGMVPADVRTPGGMLSLATHAVMIYSGFTAEDDDCDGGASARVDAGSPPCSPLGRRKHMSPYKPPLSWQTANTAAAASGGGGEWRMRYRKFGIVEPITLCVTTTDGDVLFISAIEGNLYDPASEVRQLQLQISDFVRSASAQRTSCDWQAAITNASLLAAHITERICQPIAESAEATWQATLEATSPPSPCGYAKSASTGSFFTPAGAGLNQRRSPAGALAQGREPKATGSRFLRNGSVKPAARSQLVSEDEGYVGEAESMHGGSPPPHMRMSRRCSTAPYVLTERVSQPLYVAATTSGALAAVVALAAVFAIVRA